MALESELVLRPHMPKWMKKQSLAGFFTINSKRKKTAIRAKDSGAECFLRPECDYSDFGTKDYIEEQQSTNEKKGILKEVGVRKESKQLTWAAGTIFVERDRVRRIMFNRRGKCMRKRLEGRPEEEEVYVPRQPARHRKKLVPTIEAG